MLQKDFVKISWRFRPRRKKRKIIGREFVAVFDEESHKFEGAKFLAQGTIYPDVIESQSVKGPFCCDKISPQCRWIAGRNETSTSRTAS